MLLGVLGAAVGGQLNRAIYRWAWNQRSISPWSAAPASAPRRTWMDCLPIVGWWCLRRESKIHGSAFWIRPMLIEFVVALGLPVLYYWEMQGSQLPAVFVPPPPALFPSLLATFCANAVLLALMIVATFIDIDEKTIPDFITVPGTLIALSLAILLPDSLLPVMRAAPPSPGPILLTTPSAWAPALTGVNGLVAALACWFGWCYALLPKTIYTRRGIAKAVRYLIASTLRHRLSKWIGAMSLLGTVVIVGVWNLAGAPWQTLLSSLVGLAFGGGLVWAIRAVSGYVLGVEAMGFGDVTLMAMIGAFLGWQAAMMTFFLAPFTSLLIAVSQWLMTGRRDIPFGPFLCAAAGIVMVGWGVIWARWGLIFSLGIFIPLIVVAAIAMMGVMLALLQLVKRLLGSQAA